MSTDRTARSAAVVELEQRLAQARARAQQSQARLRAAAAVRLEGLDQQALRSPALSFGSACRERLGALADAAGAGQGSAHLRLCRELHGLSQELWRAEEAQRRSEREARGALLAAMNDLEAAAPALRGLRALLWEIPLEPSTPRRLQALRGLLALRYDSVPRILALPRPWKKS